MNTISQFNAMKFRNASAQKSDKSAAQNQSISGANLPYTKRLNYSPIAIGAINAGCWFGVGVCLDKLFSKLSNKPANTKQAIVMEAVLGTLAGIYAYKVAKSENSRTS